MLSVTSTRKTKQSFLPSRSFAAASNIDGSNRLLSTEQPQEDLSRHKLIKELKPAAGQHEKVKARDVC